MDPSSRPPTPPLFPRASRFPSTTERPPISRDGPSPGSTAYRPRAANSTWRSSLAERSSSTSFRRWDDRKKATLGDGTTYPGRGDAHNRAARFAISIGSLPTLVFGCRSVRTAARGAAGSITAAPSGLSTPCRSRPAAGPRPGPSHLRIRRHESLPTIDVGHPGGPDRQGLLSRVPAGWERGRGP
jgi:hypothetical protein